MAAIRRGTRYRSMLSPMIDCFGDRVVSGSIGTQPDAEWVNMVSGLPQPKGSCTS